MTVSLNGLLFYELWLFVVFVVRYAINLWRRTTGFVSIFENISALNLRPELILFDLKAWPQYLDFRSKPG
jgi:hypothetical protein